MTETDDRKQDRARRQQDFEEALNLYHATKDEFGLQAPVTQARLEQVQQMRKRLADLDQDELSRVDQTIPDDDGVRSPYNTHYKPRDGFTIPKIKKHMRTLSTLSSKASFKSLYDEKGRSAFAREIRKFASPQEFADHLFFHGTGGYVSGGLKPGSLLPKNTEFGGGYGEAYNVISLSKSKNIASNFTGQSSHGQVYPVILRQGAKVISMPNIHDSQELEDILPELWQRGIDAIRIGDWSSAHSEQELCVINPRAIIRGAGESFAVFHKTAFAEPTDEEIVDVYQRAINPDKSSSGL